MPVETRLLADARARGCRTLSGTGMVALQAADAMELFAGVRPDRERMLEHVAELVAAPRGGLKVRRSIATVCLSGTLEEKLEAAASAGFDEVELFEPDLIASALAPEEVRDRAGRLGLEIGLYQPFRDFEAVPEALLRENLRRAERKFGVMERLGADTMLVCSNVSEAAIDDDALAAAQLRALAEQAAGHGIRIAYEALAWGRHVRDYDHAWRIVEAADHPNLGTCLDSFHILSRGADPSGIRDIPGEKIFYLQLADAPQLVMDVLQWSRHYRCFPGQGGFDLAAFLGHVLATGYAGPLSLEVFNDVFRQADPRRMAVDAMRSLIVLEEAAGLASLPAPTTLGGYAFVELAVAAGAAADVERLLIAMGFRHAGQHRSKPVQLWRHGGTHILVNHGDGGQPRPRIAAIAVESPEPLRSAERAERLLAPLLPRERGPGEAELSAIAAPDGTSVFFCRTDARGAGGWLSDFLTAGPPGDAVPGGSGGDRPRRALPAVRLLRRGGAVLPLGARARVAPRRRAGHAGRARAQPRGPGRPRQRPLRAQRADRRQRPLGAAAPRARQPRRVRRRARHARSRRAGAAHPRQLLRGPRGAHQPATGDDRAPARRSTSSTTRPAERSSCTSTRRSSARASSSRSSSGAADTTPTAPSTHRSGSRRSVSEEAVR